jgi:hypothetical protein
VIYTGLSSFTVGSNELELTLNDALPVDEYSNIFVRVNNTTYDPDLVRFEGMEMGLNKEILK